MTAEENSLRRQGKEAKELAKWQKEKARPKHKLYIWYLFLILTLIYIIDEAITYSPSQLQDGIITSFFKNDSVAYAEWYRTGVSKMGILSTISILLMIPACFYKPLADRFGRKIFLFINTLGMAVAMAICFLATKSFIVYAIGFVLMRWFVTPDEQVVYIFETAPKDKRATLYSLIKGTAEFGLFLIPWFRTLFMKSDTSGWNYVFLVLACIGFVIALLVLFFARESDVFLDQRISYLSLPEEEKERLKQAKFNNKKKQGGLISAIVYAMKNKQLRWIFICTALFTLARCVPDSSTNIMKLYWGESSTTTDLISQAQFILPIGAGVLTIVYGLVSDKIGRKLISIVMLALCIIFLLMFVFAAKFNWGIATVGIFIGLYQAAYAGTGDIYIMMAGESAPTNLRASVMAAQSLFYGVGQLLSSVLLSAFTGAVKGLDLGYFCLFLAVPCFAISLIFLMLKVKETKGLDIEAIDHGALEDQPQSN